ncbi:hypothetical protein JW758_03805 [Candidatus Peregrinibacteria bacterium]|nr:hypothetical protein [Candidatus Peregrinibacteria bacterium]
MKITKALFLTLFLSSILLVGCNATEEVTDMDAEPAMDAGTIAPEMTEEERVAEMIKAIEAEEARMAAEGTEEAEEVMEEASEEAPSEDDMNPTEDEVDDTM